MAISFALPTRAREAPRDVGDLEPRHHETEAVRAWAEIVRRDLKVYEAHGGSLASFLPGVKRAQRHVRRGDLDGALRILRIVDDHLKVRLIGEDL